MSRPRRADHAQPDHAQTLMEVFRRLERHYGPTHWWPGETPFEIAVGAVLTQNTAWTNVERAIANLKQRNWLDPSAILGAPDDELHEALRPSGYFRIKAKRLRSFCTWLLREFGGSMEWMAKQPLEELRPRLLEVNGIGPETADDILLYACEKPVFVVDAYTRRIWSRHGWVEGDVKYEPLRAYFEDSLAADIGLFKEYHGLIVFTGKDHCRRRPRCEGCPLKPMLPPEGPLE
jgi:endonuclease-3 related protein